MQTVVTQNDIITRLAAGETSLSIAKDHDIGPSGVRMIKMKNRELIESITARLISDNLEAAAESVALDIKTVLRIAKRAHDNVDDLSDNELLYKQQHNKTIDQMMRAIGFYPTQSPSLVVQNIVNDNSQHITVTPEFQQFIDYQTDKNVDKDAEKDVNIT